MERIPDQSSQRLDFPKFPDDLRIQGHRMALRALTLSLLLNGKKYISLHKSIESLPDERKIQIQKIRKKRFLRKKSKLKQVRTTHEEHVHHAQELVDEMHDVLTHIDDIRQRFYQQIEDTNLSGFTDLSNHYAARLLFLESMGARALTVLEEAEEGVVKVHLLEILKDRIAQTRNALTEQLEWLPNMKELIFDPSSQYQSIMQVAY